MTIRQIIIFTCAYMVALVVVVYFTRATSRRIAGALAGGAAVGCFGTRHRPNALPATIAPIPKHPTAAPPAKAPAIRREVARVK